MRRRTYVVFSVHKFPPPPNLVFYDLNTGTYLGGIRFIGFRYPVWCYAMAAMVDLESRVAEDAGYSAGESLFSRSAIIYSGFIRIIVLKLSDQLPVIDVRA